MVVPFIIFAFVEFHLSRIPRDRKSTRLNSSHSQISYAVFCLKKKKKQQTTHHTYDHTFIHLSRRCRAWTSATAPSLLHILTATRDAPAHPQHASSSPYISHS